MGAIKARARVARREASGARPAPWTNSTATGHLDRLIALAMEEDLGSIGDVTSRALFGPEDAGEGELLAKQPLLLAGTEATERTFHAVDPATRVEWLRREGDWVERGEIVARVRGRCRALLAAERTALNFLQRLCGIATASREAVSALDGTSTRLLDTRKTTPGFRALEKHAVAVGGAKNHRFGLFDGVLIKDNHIAAVGSVKEATRRARAAAPHHLRVEVEVSSLAEAQEALEAGADILLLDNMGLEQMREAVALVRGRAQTEASGGVTLDRLPAIAATGVDFVSMGALTHSAPAADLSFEVKKRR